MERVPIVKKIPVSTVTYGKNIARNVQRVQWGQAGSVGGDRGRGKTEVRRGAVEAAQSAKNVAVKLISLRFVARGRVRVRRWPAIPRKRSKAHRSA